MNRYLKNQSWVKVVSLAVLAVFLLPVLVAAMIGLASQATPEGVLTCAAVGTTLTLLDVAKRTGNDATIGVIEEVTTVAPEVGVFPARPKSGTSYKLFQRLGLPKGAFRDANAGAALTKSTTTQKLAQMFFFDCPLQVDEAIVKADDGELGDILADEAVAATQGSMIELGNSVWYGDNASDKGFDGLENFLTDELSATGSGNDTCSAYLVWLDPRYKGVFFDVGNQGMMEFGEWIKQQVSDPADAARKYMAYVNNMSFYLGLNIGSDKSVYRVKNITAAKPLTDALGSELLSKVPLARRAGLRWFMNRDAQFFLQKSRSAVGAQKSNSAGDAFAQTPTELAGVPITYTDSLTSSEVAA